MAYRTAAGTYSRFGDLMQRGYDPALRRMGAKNPYYDPWNPNRAVAAEAYQQGLERTQKAYYQQRQDIKQGASAAVGTLQAGLPAFQNFADSLSKGIGASIESYMADVEKAVADVDEARLRALGYVDTTLPEILGEYDRMYTGSMEHLRKFADQADPQKLMSLGWSQMETEFNKFRQDTAKQLQAGGYSPKVLNQMGHNQLATLLEYGGKQAANITEQAMGLQRQAAQMGMDVESRRAQLAGGARETATGRKVAIETDMARLGTGYRMQAAGDKLRFGSDVDRLRLEALRSGQAARGQIAQYQYGQGQDLAKLQPDYLGAGLKFASMFPTKVQQGASYVPYYYKGGQKQNIRTNKRERPAYSQAALYRRS